MCLRLCVAVPGPGVGSGRRGEDLVGPEESPRQAAAGPVHQQQSQAAGLVLLYPSGFSSVHRGTFSPPLPNLEKYNKVGGAKIQ